VLPPLHLPPPEAGSGGVDIDFSGAHRALLSLRTLLISAATPAAQCPTPPAACESRGPAGALEDTLRRLRLLSAEDVYTAFAKSAEADDSGADLLWALQRALLSAASAGCFPHAPTDRGLAPPHATLLAALQVCPLLLLASLRCEALVSEADPGTGTGRDTAEEAGNGAARAVAVLCGTFDAAEEGDPVEWVRLGLLLLRQGLSDSEPDPDPAAKLPAHNGVDLDAVETACHVLQLSFSLHAPVFQRSPAPAAPSTALLAGSFLLRALRLALQPGRAEGAGGAGLPLHHLLAFPSLRLPPVLAAARRLVHACLGVQGRCRPVAADPCQRAVCALASLYAAAKATCPSSAALLLDMVAGIDEPSAQGGFCGATTPDDAHIASTTSVLPRLGNALLSAINDFSGEADALANTSMIPIALLGRPHPDAPLTLLYQDLHCLLALLDLTTDLVSANHVLLYANDMDAAQEMTLREITGFGDVPPEGPVRSDESEEVRQQRKARGLLQLRLQDAWLLFAQTITAMESK
jgi:hypothetical protein